MSTVKFDTDYTAHRKRPRITTIALAFIIALIAFPVATSAVASPVGFQNSSDELRAIESLGYAGIVDPEVTFVTVDDLHVLGSKATGYVNVFDENDVIYLRPFSSREFNESRSYWNAIVIHEYGHILQKRLVESITDNPYERYSELVKLNAILSDGAPAIPNEEEDGERVVIFSGLETNADCILMVLRGSLRSGYIDAIDGCELRPSAIAASIIDGEYPTEASIAKYEEIVQARWDKEQKERIAAFEEYLERETNRHGE